MIELTEIEARIERELPGADATVRRTRGEEDDDHLAADVVAPQFAERSLVEQHELVHDALGDLLTTEIHAIELRTRAPEESDASP